MDIFSEGQTHVWYGYMYYKITTVHLMCVDLAIYALSVCVCAPFFSFETTFISIVFHGVKILFLFV